MKRVKQFCLEAVMLLLSLVVLLLWFPALKQEVKSGSLSVCRTAFIWETMKMYS